MPKEMTLNDPLSGAEIKQIMLAKVAEALDNNCTLVDDVTYPGFSFAFQGAVTFSRSITGSTIVWGEVSKGDPGGMAEDFAGQYATDSPDRARDENNLPVPVMISTPSGPRREKVRFKRPEAYKKAPDA